MGPERFGGSGIGRNGHTGLVPAAGRGGPPALKPVARDKPGTGYGLPDRRRPDGPSLEAPATSTRSALTSPATLATSADRRPPTDRAAVPPSRSDRSQSAEAGPGQEVGPAVAAPARGARYRVRLPRTRSEMMSRHT